MSKQSGVQYRERITVNPHYDKLENITACAPCPGTCSCNLEKRSAYDQLQHQAMVSGQDNYAFQQNTRQLNFNYNNTLNSYENIVENFSGMHDNYNPATYLLWPAMSEKCHAGLGGGTSQFVSGKGPQYRENFTYISQHAR